MTLDVAARMKQLFTEKGRLKVMITAELIEEILAIIGFALSMLLVAYIYSTPKQNPIEENDDSEFIGLRSLEGIPNAK